MQWKQMAAKVRAHNAKRMLIDQGIPSAGVKDTRTLIEQYNNMERFYWLALAGEVGEACNLVKKRWRDGPRWSDATRAANLHALREELADVRIYTEALADLYDIDLDAECERKMREVEKRPFAQKV